MPADPTSPLPRLLQFARRHWRMAAAQMGLAVVGTSLFLVFPSVVQWFIDDIIPNKKLDELYLASALAAAVGVMVHRSASWSANVSSRW